jgi:hypothetical protein
MFKVGDTVKRKPGAAAWNDAYLSQIGKVIDIHVSEEIKPSAVVQWYLPSGNVDFIGQYYHEKLMLHTTVNTLGNFPKKTEEGGEG